MPDAYRPIWAIERQIEKLRAHLRTPRGRRDFAAVERLAALNAERDGKDWHGRREMNELLKVLYPPSDIARMALPAYHPLLSMVRREPPSDGVYAQPVTYLKP